MTSEPIATYSPRRWIALGVLLVAAAMDLIGATVVTLGLPAIHDDLGASEAALEWIIAGYGLAFALGLITGGRLGDVYGRRRVFLVGLAAFTATSALCGLAPIPAVLVAARVAQGLSAALMIPQVLSVITTGFPAEDRAKAFAMFGATAGVATVLGPLLSGLLIRIDLFGLAWRPIFLINVPLGVATFVAARAMLEESRTDRPARLDLVGTALVTAALVLVLVPLVDGAQRGWPAWTLVALASSIPAFAVFAVHQRRLERRARSPLVPPGLFRQRAFTGGMIATLAFFAGPPALLFVTTLSLEGLGFSALHTALTFVPLSLASVPAAAASGVLAQRFGRRLPAGGALLVTIGIGTLLAALHIAGSAVTTWALLPGMILIGVGLGLVAPTLINVVLAEVDPQDAGAASGALNTVLQLAGSIGIALTGIAFFGALPDTPASANRATGYADAMTSALWLALGIAALSTLAMLLLPRPPRHALHGTELAPQHDAASPERLAGAASATAT
jgi:EmrB/QacA subfamily drug resistance transporter